MTITRDNFDAIWLARRPAAAAYTKFKHLPLREQSAKRKPALPALRAAVVHHHIDPKAVEGALTRLGYPRVLDLLSKRLPVRHSTRMGSFGEVIASEHLAQRYGYQLPIFKLRFADHPPLVEPGPDVDIHTLDASEGFETFVTSIHRVIDRHGRGGADTADLLDQPLALRGIGCLR